MEEGRAGRSGGAEQNRGAPQACAHPGHSACAAACSPTSCGYDKPQGRRTLSQGNVRLVGFAGGRGRSGAVTKKGAVSTPSGREKEDGSQRGLLEPLPAQWSPESKGEWGASGQGPADTQGLSEDLGFQRCKAVCRARSFETGEALSPSQGGPGCTGVEWQQGHPGDSWPRATR